MEWIKANLAIVITAMGVIGSGLTYSAGCLIEYGEMKAKTELNEEYNEVIVESMLARNQLELCCSE